jgi:uncharacterized protein
MADQTISSAVPTANAQRYLQQLCRHWQHKLKVSMSDDAAEIEMFSGDTVHLQSKDDALDVAIRSINSDTLDVTRGVVEDHLNRFAFREAPLRFEWTAS